VFFVHTTTKELEMRFVLDRLRRLGAFLLGLVMEVFRGVGHAIAEMLRSAFYRSGRFIGKLLTWALLAMLAVWILQTQPELVFPAISIGILVYAIRIIVTAPFRKRRK
jgi:hypothetical protein